ncbi:MAG: right-handed parallel beta-helix repeat-containing protein [Planctomycetes bacterium]|nr:right-handed parallel beta-helix repeat-containing protein [Planctomycetota bacterium]
MLRTICLVVSLPLLVPIEGVAQSSHPPLRTEPAPAKRALGEGPTYFVDALRGDDTHDGTEAAPWRTIAHGLGRVKPGDTLCLRGGTYYENVLVSVAGRQDAPITIRGFPGERAVIDGSLREFFEQPEIAWEPFAGGAEDEYRSARRYPNLRQALGSFGDSMVGLQTYYHAQDLRSDSGVVDWEDWDRRDETDLKPLYCGPGIWYDAGTGYVHARLAHTHLPEPLPNYRGPTDPRKLPLLLAAFRSIPLRVDGAEHVRFQDLVIRGAGYDAVVLDQAQHVLFDNVTVWCGTYGLRAIGTRHLRIENSGFYGNLAPWTFRGDGSKRDYPGRPHRNISRLNTHAVLVVDSGRESSVYAFPQNDDWDIAHCEFTDAHDGLYLGAINVRFHHNLVENMQDDGVYLSPMYLRHRLEQQDPEIHLFQNVFRQVLTALAFGGPEPITRDTVFVYRNEFDLRRPVQTGRPSTLSEEPGLTVGKMLGDHGSPPWSAMNIYHNTFVTAESDRDAAMGTVGHTGSGHPRRTFNNIFVHHARLPGFMPPNAEQNAACDGNLYWSPHATPSQADALFAKYRKSAAFEQSRAIYDPGSTTHAVVADPRFRSYSPEPDAANDYRLQTGSPAAGAGVTIPTEWPDPLRKIEGRPDVGAYPLESEPLDVGRRSES